MRIVALILTGLLFVTLGCAQRPTDYRADPYIDSRSIKPVENQTAYIEVIPPNKSLEQAGQSSDRINLNPSNDFAAKIKENIIASLIEQGYQISSNPHFANVTMQFDFSQMEVTIDKGSVRDRLEADATLTVTLTKKPQTINKRFSRSQTLDVALKATPAEITGLTNQVIGELLASAFADAELSRFM